MPTSLPVLLTLCTLVLASLPARASDEAPAAAPAAEEPRIRGVVRETVTSGGYTYVLVEQADGEQIWIAGPMLDVQVGVEVSSTMGSVMADFHSRTLNRTFDRVRFVHRIVIGDEEQVAMAHDAVEAGAPITDVAVEPLSGGVTIETLYSDAARLGGTPVALRATVVKSATGILGSNWLHLQDGTGNAALGTHDIVATTSQEIERGAVVVVRGTLRTDRDFGMGYRYAVILEDAVVEVE